MGLVYVLLILSFIVLFFINISFIVINIYFWATDGVQYILHGRSFIENVYYSTYLKWIVLSDVLWIMMMLIFLLRRKHYKTDPKLHYLDYRPIDDLRICVIIPTYNEEIVAEEVIRDYINQRYVKHVIVIDNHSTDSTVEIAKRCGATVITKESNKGLADSLFRGLKESLRTDANIVVITECDGTFSGNDISKMIPYLDNCDMVIGTRQVQVLTEKGNQNSMFYVWGNYLLAKLIQVKYFSSLHLGIVQLTDVGCMYRCMRLDALERIIDKFTSPTTGELIIKGTSVLFPILNILVGIENNLKIVEVPITFKKRIGISKTEADKKITAIKYGLMFFWYIIRR